MSRYMVFNVGCIECGVSSEIVGIFSQLTTAEEVAEECCRTHSWRQCGQNNFEIFDLQKYPEEKITEEYTIARSR